MTQTIYDKKHFWNPAIRTDPNVDPSRLAQRDQLYNEMTSWATSSATRRPRRSSMSSSPSRRAVVAAFLAVVRNARANYSRSLISPL